MGVGACLLWFITPNAAGVPTLSAPALMKLPPVCELVVLTVREPEPCLFTVAVPAMEPLD